MTASVSRRVGEIPPMHGDPRAACGPGKISAIVRLSFFPDKRSPFVTARNANAAKRVCVDCPIVQACGRWALRSGEPFGVWGAMSAEDRERLLNPPTQPG